MYTELIRLHDLISKNPDFSEQIQREGYTPLSVAILAELNSEGVIVSATLLPDKAVKGQPHPRKLSTMVTDDSVARTSGVCPHPVDDKISYLLGSTAKRGAELADAYEKQVRSIAASCPGTKLDLIVKWLDAGRPGKELLIQEAAKEAKWEKLPEIPLPPGELLDEEKKVSTLFYGALVQWTHGGRAICLDDAVGDAVANYLQAGASGGAVGLCMVTGEDDVLLRAKHPPIEGGKPKLISSDSDNLIYVSSGVKDMAQVGSKAAFKLKEGFRWLKANRGHYLGEVVYMGWAPERADCEDPLAAVFGDSSEKGYDPLDDASIQGLLSRARRGAAPGTKLEEEFCLLAAKIPSKGRISIVHWEQGKAEVVYARLASYVDGARAPGYSARDKKWVSWAPTVKEIVSAMTPRAWGAMPAPYQDAVIACVLDGRTAPTTQLLRLSMSQALADVYEDKKNRDSRRAWIAAAFAKLAHIRNGGTMIEAEKDRSYLFGRLFAIHEYIHRSTGHQRTPFDQNFRRIETAPATVYAKVALATETYLKSSGKRGYEIWAQNLIREVANLMLPSDFNDTRLSPLFWLGMQHQKSILYTKKTEEPETEKKEGE